MNIISSIRTFRCNLAIFITNVKRKKKGIFPLLLGIHVQLWVLYFIMTYVLCFFVFCPRDPEM